MSENLKIFAKTIEDAAIKQIQGIYDSDFGGVESNIRIMPDAHAGKGCVVGTTMKIVDKVCPNIVGCDLGCGVLYAETKGLTKEQMFENIEKYIPSGFSVRSRNDYEDRVSFVKQLACFEQLDSNKIQRAFLSVGTLGGGNHFIESYEDGSVSIHTGSRNLGLTVYKHYQALAEKQQRMAWEKGKENFEEVLKTLPSKQREAFVKSNKKKFDLDKDLAYLTGVELENYLHDVAIVQRYARINRAVILENLVKGGIVYGQTIDTIHNYVDVKNGILRKGSVSANKGEKLVIPLNMRDGLLICVGKGNEDWNNSAPHGAGRLYSRTEARKSISLDDYKKSMEGIYSPCVCEETIDEAPFAYKDYEEIMSAIEPTVDILDRKKPVFNFKATK